jgi:hypothetical protein
VKAEGRALLLRRKGRNDVTRLRIAVLCLVALGGVNRASAAPVTLELTGVLNAPPRFNAAFAPPYDVFLRMSFDSPPPPVSVEGQPPYYGGYVFPVTLEGSVGGVTFAPFRNASWTQIHEHDGDGLAHVVFEIDFIDPTSFRVEGGYMRAMLLYFNFAPGGFPLNAPFPSQFPVDALTSTSGEMHFGPPFWHPAGQPITAGSSSVTFTSVREVPEPATWLLLALGLLASHRLPVRRG